MPSAASARAALIRASALFIVETFYSAGMQKNAVKSRVTKARVGIDRSDLCARSGIHSSFR